MVLHVWHRHRCVLNAVLRQHWNDDAGSLHLTLPRRASRKLPLLALYAPPVCLHSTPCLSPSRRGSTPQLPGSSIAHGKRRTPPVATLGAFELGGGSLHWKQTKDRTRHRGRPRRLFNRSLAASGYEPTPPSSSSTFAVGAFFAEGIWPWVFSICQVLLQ